MNNLMDTEVNLMDIETGGDFLDVGYHNVIVFSISEGGEYGKTPYIEIVFKSEQDQTHQARFYWTEKAMWRIKSLAVACGFDPNDSHFKIKHTIDKWLTIELHKEEYNGKSLTKLKNVYPCEKEGLKVDSWDDAPKKTDEIPEVDIGDGTDDPF